MHGMTPLWTSQEIAEAVNGRASAEFACKNIAFDSREIEQGDLFIALKGEVSDGHAYVDQCFEKGAAGAIVSNPVAGPHILVADTTVALEDLARAARARVGAKIIGVTGSAGKTGTKEALFAALDRFSRGHAHRSVKSYNNHVGVPLSLSRMPRDAQFGIFEMGMNHEGELRALTRLVRPHIAIITTIAPAHIGHFSGEEAIAAAKAEIFEGLEPGGTAIIPADNPHHAQLRAVAEKYAGTIISFGFSEHADVRAVEYVDADNGGSLITASLPTGTLCYTLSQPGEHWIANSLAILAAVHAAGADLAMAGLAMADLSGLAGRGARHEIAVPGGTALLIDESYNANPASMRVTIAAMGGTPARRRIALLGTMGELGAAADEYHLKIYDQLIAAKVDYAILVGEGMAVLVRKLSSGVEHGFNFDHCDTAQDALVRLRNYIGDGDVVLVKGSNYLGLSKIVSSLLDGSD